MSPTCKPTTSFATMCYYFRTYYLSKKQANHILCDDVFFFVSRLTLHPESNVLEITRKREFWDYENMIQK